MADIAAANVTVTTVDPHGTYNAGDKATGQKEVDLRPGLNGYRRVLVKIAFGDGALTYPSGGVPMPTSGSWTATVAGTTGNRAPKGYSFGMARGLKYLDVVDSGAASGIVWKWDYTNKTLRGYRSGAYSPVYTATDGSTIYTYAVGNGDTKGSATVDVGIAGGALQTNGGLISNLAAANNTTAFTIAVHPDVARNVGIAFKNTNAGASAGNAVSCVITGTFRGAAQTETISFSAAELNSTVQNEVATKYGSKPFDTVTSITNPVAQPAGWQHAAGPGSKMGLYVDPDTNAESDIIKLTKNAADLAITGLYDATNKTVNFGVLSDGDDCNVVYKVDYDGAAGTISALSATNLAELVAATTAPAAQTIYAVAIGW